MGSGHQNTLAMSAAANLLELQGYPALAYFQASTAVDTYYASNPDLTEPPSNLLTILKRSMEAMLAAGALESPTTTSVSLPTITFSPASQTVTLSATVAATTNGPVEGGTVTLVVSGVGNPVTSSPVSQGDASIAFTVPAGTKVGSYSIQALYSGTPSFAPSVDSADSLTISKATPAITWNPPASVPAGTTLGTDQLNATASVPGTFVYNPPAGTILTGGSTQTLNVTFTPNDSTDYNSAAASVSIEVLACSFSGSVSPTSATIKVGSSKTFVITITPSNFQGPVSFNCAHPPKGISCSFNPNQANLTANGSTTTTLTVTVSAKPTSGTRLPSLRLPADQRSSPRIIPLPFGMILLVLTTLLAMIGVRRPAFFGTSAPRRALLLTLVLFLAITLNSCTSATFLGSGSPGSGGNGTSDTISIVIQGTSGGTVITIAIICVTVP